MGRLHIVELANRAIDVAGKNLTIYDAILVDEGQDYNPTWWNTLRRVLKDNGEMMLVADETQDLYKRARSWTEAAMNGAGFSGPWVQLEVSYRMPPLLTEHLRDFAQQHLLNIKVNLPTAEQSELVLYPTHLQWIQLEDCDQTATECVNAVLQMPELVKSQIMAYSDIVLLVPNHRIGLNCVDRL